MKKSQKLSKKAKMVSSCRHLTEKDSFLILTWPSTKPWEKSQKLSKMAKTVSKINHQEIGFYKRVIFGGWWPLVASKTVYYYYYHFLLQKFWGYWDSGTFMIYQALFSFLLTFPRVFSTMRNWVRWVVEFSIFGHKVRLILSSKGIFVYRISS